jgi:hypothetical protein
MVKTRPEERMQSIFVKHPLMLEVYRDKLKPIAGNRSKKGGRHLQVDIHLHHTGVRHCSFH